MSGVAGLDDLLGRLLETKGATLPSRGGYERAFAELLDGARHTPRTSHDLEYLGWQLELKRTRSRHDWINCLRLMERPAENNAYVFIKTVDDVIADIQVMLACDVASIVLDDSVKDAAPSFKRSEDVQDWNLQARMQHARVCALATQFARRRKGQGE